MSRTVIHTNVERTSRPGFNLSNNTTTRYFFPNSQLPQGTNYVSSEHAITINGRNINHLGSVKIIVEYEDADTHESKREKLDMSEFKGVSVVVEGDAKDVSVQNGNVIVQGSATSVKGSNGSIEVGQNITGNCQTSNGVISAYNIGGNATTCNAQIHVKGQVDGSCFTSNGMVINNSKKKRK